MIINKNSYGIQFEPDEILWTLNDEEVSYKEVEEAVSKVKGVESIAVGVEDGKSQQCSTDEMSWEMSWNIEIYKYNGKFAIRTYIWAEPLELVEDLEELESSEEDYNSVAEEINASLAAEGYYVSLGDYWGALEGDYAHMRDDYDSLEEAFSQIPIAFDKMYAYMEMRDKFIHRMLEHYEE